MNSHAMMLGAGQAQPPPKTTVLFRPVWNGSAWVVSNAAQSVGGPAISAVTGLTIGEDGTGPFGAGSRAIIDTLTTSIQDAYTVGTSKLAIASLKDMELFCKVPTRPVTYPRYLLWVGPKGSAVNNLSVGVTPAGAATSRMKYFAAYRHGDSVDYPIFSADFTYGDFYRHLRACVVANSVRLWVDGVYQGSVALPVNYSVRATPLCLLGGNYVHHAAHDGYGSYAEARISSDYRYTTAAENFTPPASPLEI